MNWLLCLFRGHQPKALIAYDSGKAPHYVYHCTRCRRVVEPQS